MLKFPNQHLRRVASKKRCPFLCPYHGCPLVQNPPVTAIGRLIRIFRLWRPNKPVRTKTITDRNCRHILHIHQIHVDTVCGSAIEATPVNKVHYGGFMTIIKISFVQVNVNVMTVLRVRLVNSIPIIASTTKEKFILVC